MITIEEEGLVVVDPLMAIPQIQSRDRATVALLAGLGPLWGRASEQRELA